MSTFSLLRNGVSDMQKLIPDAKQEISPVNSVMIYIEAVERENESLKMENNMLKSQIETMKLDANFQDKFVTVYKASDDDFKIENFDDLDMDHSISLLEAQLQKQNDSIENMIRRYLDEENNENEKRNLEKQRMKIVEQFEKLFIDNSTDVLDAETQNAQLKERMQKIYEMFNKYKDVFSILEQKYGYRFSSEPTKFIKALIDKDTNDVYLNSFIRELAAIFSFKDELNENSVNAQHPFYEGSYCTRLVHHIKSLIGAEALHTKIKTFKEKYRFMLKRYKQLRAENIMTRKALANVTELDTSDTNTPLQTIVTRGMTKFVTKCYERTSRVINETIGEVDTRLAAIEEKINVSVSKMYQAGLAYALIKLRVGTSQSEMNEAAAINAQQLFDAVFPAHMNISPFSSNDEIKNGIKVLRELTEKIFSEIGENTPTSQCLLTRIAALRRAVRNSQSSSFSGNSSFLSYSSSLL